jgi:hypothetical protein
MAYIMRAISSININNGFRRASPDIGCQLGQTPAVKDLSVRKPSFS